VWNTIIYTIILLLLIPSVSLQTIHVTYGDSPVNHLYQLYVYRVVSGDESVTALYNVSLDRSGCIASITTTINNVTTHLDTYGYKFMVRLVKILGYRGDLTNLLYRRGAGKYIVKNYIVCRQNLSLIPRTTSEFLHFPYYLDPSITRINNTIILEDKEWRIVAVYDHGTGWLKHLEAYSNNTVITIDRWQNIRDSSTGWNQWIILIIAIIASITITAYVFLRRK
jgi:hypothetical protein